jgi:hypothetical protein
LAFQSFDFERTWWSIFQKRVVRTESDILVRIFIVARKAMSQIKIFFLYARLSWHVLIISILYLKVPVQHNKR